jgi:hypothetical protein
MNQIRAQTDDVAVIVSDSIGTASFCGKVMVLVLSLVYFEFLVGMGCSALTMARLSIRTPSTSVGRNWNCFLGATLTDYASSAFIERKL